MVARLLLVVGYGFADEHINGILTQALRGKPDKRLLVATYCGDGDVDKQREDYVNYVTKKLELSDADGKIFVHIARAKKFLGEELCLAMASSIFPEVEDIFASASPAAPSLPDRPDA